MSGGICEARQYFGVAIPLVHVTPPLTIETITLCVFAVIYNSLRRFVEGLRINQVRNVVIVVIVIVIIASAGATRLVTAVLTGDFFQIGEIVGTQLPKRRRVTHNTQCLSPCKLSDHAQSHKFGPDSGCRGGDPGGAWFPRGPR